MKENKLNYVLVICLVIISLLITILFMSKNMNKSKSKSKSKYKSKSKDIKKYRNAKTINYHDYTPNYPNYNDVDYAYDYNGNWFQPSRWWNNNNNNINNNILINIML